MQRSPYITDIKSIVHPGEVRCLQYTGLHCTGLGWHPVLVFSSRVQALLLSSYTVQPCIHAFAVLQLSGSCRNLGSCRQGVGLPCRTPVMANWVYNEAPELQPRHNTASAVLLMMFHVHRRSWRPMRCVQGALCVTFCCC